MNYFVKIPGIEIDKWAPDFDWDRLLTLWQNNGIEGLIIPITLNDQLEGFTDRVQNLIKIARQKNLQSWIVLPILLNNLFFNRFPDKQPVHRLREENSFPNWFTPICPSNEEYRFFFEESAYKLFNQLEVDAVMFDYLRTPYFWEKLGNEVDENEWPLFCYCESCVKNFEDRSQINFDEAKLPDWQNWQCLILSDWLERICKQISAVRPGTQIGAQILPLMSKNNHELCSEWIGQNLDYFQSNIHFFSPLIYERLLNWNHDDALSYLVNILSKQKLPVIPSIQISRIKWDRKTEDDDNQKDLIQRMKLLGINSVSVFHGRELLSEKGIRLYLG